MWQASVLCHGHGGLRGVYVKAKTSTLLETTKKTWNKDNFNPFSGQNFHSFSLYVLWATRKPNNTKSDKENGHSLPPTILGVRQQASSSSSSPRSRWRDAVITSSVSARSPLALPHTFSSPVLSFPSLLSTELSCALMDVSPRGHRGFVHVLVTQTQIHNPHPNLHKVGQ